MPEAKKQPANKKKSAGIAFASSVMFFTIVTSIVWLTPLNTYLVAALTTTAIISTLIGVICYWVLIKRTPKSKEQAIDKELIEKRKKQLASHFLRMISGQKRKIRLSSRYDQPIYLLLSDDPSKDKSIITQMGYEAYKLDDFGNDIEFPILFWVCEHSILISISMGDDQHPEYLKTLCQSLNSWRPRQAANGLLLTTEVSNLLKNNEQITQAADELKSTIKTFNQAFGVSLPIYNIISNMGSISDFCQFFSAFDESKRDDVFGATSPYNKHGGIDADWFNEEYDHLISQLIANMSSALAGQLNQDYRNSIASAPFQFGLLKQSLWLFLHRLYRGEQLSDALQFRGFYFTHDGQNSPQSDLLASTVSYSAGHEYYQQHEQIPVSQTLFAQHLMTHVILNEHELVGVNKRKENTLLFNQIAFTTAWVGLLATALLVIKFDFDFQSQRENRADNMLERYKEAISASPYDIENMADNIPNLYSLQRIYSLYNQPEPWYTLPFMPNPSIKPEIEQAYFSELQRVLVPSMEKTLEKDLFVYVNLEDQSRTLSLLNNYRLLFSKDRTNIEELKAYYVKTLQDQGEADSVSIAQLKVLLNDIFERNLIPKKSNQDLESLAKKVITQTGIETLLYEHILSSPRYASRVDIRNELGDNFKSIFSFSSNYVGYLVPYIYTPTGFNELDLSVSSEVLKEALQSYEGVAGAYPSALELHRISRELKQTYQNDYINYWRDFIRNIEVTGVSNPSDLNRVLTTLSGASDNPLSSLYTTITKYTYVELATANDDTKTKDASADLPVQDPDKKESARQISLSFQDYKKQISPNDQGKKPLDSLLASFIEAKKWGDKFYQTKEPQKVAFDTLSATLQAGNPIATLAGLADDQLPLANDITTKVVTQSNEMIMSLAHDYINNAWNTEVYQPYQQRLASFYPFNQQSKSDVSVADVKAFFVNNGILDKFYQNRLSSFVASNDDSPYLPGLLPSTGLMLAPDVWTMMDKATDIKNALFLADPSNILINFQVKAVDMSSDLTEFSIIADKPIFTYRHGPTLWSQQSWQGDAKLIEKLGIELNAQETTVGKENVEGTWSWFRLIGPNVNFSTSQDTQVEFSYGESKVKLTIKTQGQSNPFVPGFFSGFSLPSGI
ncbi:type VI secretion system membrane subunit TssM [Vibrio sp. T187]|uniref:type VI secretion system membrane subunit TssM n=1 Tax=Vibrio TaxID=662 RepID=UPI0010CA04B8|nr:MULTISPECIES: type VI secretion system membrane subunit TssM [Vibrio]MBW3696940.1 type VI secretion system membrane subunit TssM [Vibrio sp. T187]